MGEGGRREQVAMPTCFSTFPKRPIMLGSSGSSSAAALGRSLSVTGVPLPTIWSTLPEDEGESFEVTVGHRKSTTLTPPRDLLPGLEVLYAGQHVQVSR